MIKVAPERVCEEPAMIREAISLKHFKEIILEVGRSIGLPIIIEEDEVKIGTGITSLVSSAEPCIVIYHPEHRKDYYNYIITQTKQGNVTFLTQYLGGDSKYYRNTVITEKSRGIVSGIINSVAQKKLQEERMYRDAVNSVIGRALEILLG